MGKHNLCYVFLYLVQFCHGAVEFYEVYEKPEIHECVAKIIQRIELMNATDVTLINVNDSLAKELHSFLEQPVRFISRSYAWPNDTMYNDVYLIQCSDYYMFLGGLDLVKRDPFWNPRAKFVIIIEYIEDYLQDVSDFLIFNHIYDIAIVVDDGDDDDVLVYTFGVERDECYRPAIKVLKVLSRCSEMHKVGNIFDTVVKTNLRGCHVKFVSHNYWPFISFAGEYAIELFLLAMIREYEGITVDLVDFGKIEQFGQRLDNFTYTGMLHEIEIYNVEGAVGGYVLTFNRMTNMDFVNPYIVDHYRMVIARAEQLGKWKAVLKQMGVVTVLCIFGTFCIVCVVVIHMNIFKKSVPDSSRDILIIWGYFLNNITQIKDTKTGVPYRLILLNILLYAIILSCAIQASLLSATTQPIRDYQPDNIDTVLSKFQLILSPNTHAYLDYTSMLNYKDSLKICTITLDCIKEVMNNDDKALYTIASDIYHQSHAEKFRDKYGELKIYTISEPIATNLQTMYIRRGSPLAEPFNRLLLRIRSGGFINKFFDRLYFSERIKYGFRAYTKKPQSLKELLGAFLVLFCGYIVSLILFVFEYLHYHSFFVQRGA